MQNFLSNIWQLRDDPDYYKKFRNGVAKLKEKFSKTDTILNQESDYFNKIIPFLDFFDIDDENVLEHKFDEALKAFLAIDGRNINNMKTGEKIQVAYMLLDFHPRFRDKVNKKNRPSNIGRDLKNFFFASQAKYYVTEDKATLKKAAFVSNYLSLRVKVENMSNFFQDFVEKILCVEAKMERPVGQRLFVARQKSKGKEKSHAPSAAQPFFAQADAG